MPRRNGRPSKILDVVESMDPETGRISYQPILDLIVTFVGMGATQETAAAAHGVEDQTLANWKKRGAEERLKQREEHKVLDETETAYVRFLELVTRAEARGLMWHELNVRRAAASGKEQGGRLSLEFLARRKRAVYGREVAVKHDGTVKVEQHTTFDAEVEQLVAALKEQADEPAAA